MAACIRPAPGQARAPRNRSRSAASTWRPTTRPTLLGVRRAVPADAIGQGPLDDDIIRRAHERTHSALQRLPGFAGLYVLADRQTGKTIAISLWETQAALRAWEHMRRPIVADQEATTGRTEQEGGSYEVVFSSEGHFMPTALLTGPAH